MSSSSSDHTSTAPATSFTETKNQPLSEVLTQLHHFSHSPQNRQLVARSPQPSGTHASSPSETLPTVFPTSLSSQFAAVSESTDSVHIPPPQSSLPTVSADDIIAVIRSSPELARNPRFATLLAPPSAAPLPQPVLEQKVDDSSSSRGTNYLSVISKLPTFPSSAPDSVLQWFHSVHARLSLLSPQPSPAQCVHIVRTLLPLAILQRPSVQAAETPDDLASAVLPACGVVTQPIDLALERSLLRQHSTETVAAFVDRILLFSVKYVTLTNSSLSNTELAATFISGLRDEEAKRYLSLQVTPRHSFEEVVSLAQRWEALQSRSPSSGILPTANTVARSTVSAVSAMPASSAPPPPSSAQSSRRRFEPTCRNCGKPGHRPSSCLAPKRQLSAAETSLLRLASAVRNLNRPPSDLDLEAISSYIANLRRSPPTSQVAASALLSFNPYAELAAIFPVTPGLPSNTSIAGSVAGCHSPVFLFVDTGSTFELVSPAFLEMINPSHITHRAVEPPRRVHGSTGTFAPTSMVDIMVVIGPISYSITAAVSPRLPVPLVLGLHFLKAVRGVVDLNHNIMAIHAPHMMRVPLIGSDATFFTEFHEPCVSAVAHLADTAVVSLISSAEPDLSQFESRGSPTAFIAAAPTSDERYYIGHVALSASDLGRMQSLSRRVTRREFAVTQDLDSDSLHLSGTEVHIPRSALERALTNLASASATAMNATSVQVAPSDRPPPAPPPSSSSPPTLPVDRTQWPKWVHDINHPDPVVRSDLQHFVFEHFSDLMCTTEFPRPCDSTFQHRIKLNGQLPRSKGRRYRLAGVESTELIRQTQVLLNNDLIEPSLAPYACPCFLVRKANGSYRLVVDFRPVNRVTDTPSFPMPTVQAILDSVAGSTVFSKLDLASGYYQVRMSPDSKDLTTFSTPIGNFRFKVMPFGLSGAPCTFQSMMQTVLGSELLWSVCVPYIDDVIIHSKSLEGHKAHLIQVAQKLRAAQLSLRPDKCSFFVSKTEYLGHIISAQGVHIDPRRVEKIVQMTPPRSHSELRSAIGLFSYVRRYIPSFAHISRPLLLALKSPTFAWTPACDTAFVQLKQLLTKAPILGHVDPTKPLTLVSDASAVAAGGVLYQYIAPRVPLRPIFYFSRTFSAIERRYSATEREALALLWMCKEARPYVFGRSFTAYTDHQPLTSLFAKDLPPGRLARFAIAMQEYRVNVRYRPGSINHDADALSRLVSSVCEDLDCPLPSPDPSLSRAAQLYAAQFNDDVLPDYASLTSSPPGWPDSIVTTSSTSTSPPISAPSAMNAQSSATNSTVPSSVSVPATPGDVSASVPDASSSFSFAADDAHALHDTEFVPGSIDVRKAQDADPVLGPMIRRIVTRCPPRTREAARYFLPSPTGPLMYRFTPKHRSAVVPLIVVPSALRRQIFEAFHASPTGGHFSPSKTFARMRRLFFYVGMRSDIRLRCESCVPCAKSSARPPSVVGPMQTRQPRRPLEQLAVDFVGPLPRTRRGNLYIFTIRDAATGFAIFTATPKCTADEAAEILYSRCVCYFGISEDVTSDNGSHFRAKLFERLLVLLGTHHSYTLPYRPQGNTYAERVHSTLNRILRTLADEHDNWDVLLPSVMFAINNTPLGDNSNITPAMAFLGFAPRGPPEHLFGDIKPLLEDSAQYGLHHLVRASQAREFLHKVRAQRQDTDKARFDSRHRSSPTYAPGTTVFLKIPTRLSKLSALNMGPFTVVKQVSPLVYVVRDATSERLANVRDMIVRPLIPSDNVKADTPAVSPPSPLSAAPPVSSSSIIPSAFASDSGKPASTSAELVPTPSPSQIVTSDAIVLPTPLSSSRSSTHVTFDVNDLTRDMMAIAFDSVSNNLFVARVLEYSVDERKMVLWHFAADKRVKFNKVPLWKRPFLPVYYNADSASDIPILSSRTLSAPYVRWTSHVRFSDVVAIFPSLSRNCIPKSVLLRLQAQSLPSLSFGVPNPLL
jgi:hypothetical protein